MSNQCLVFDSDALYEIPFFFHVNYMHKMFINTMVNESIQYLLGRIHIVIFI
jgi:hypothetical protein